jgi:hypothetical protein
MRPSQILRCESAKLTGNGRVEMGVRVELWVLGRLYSHLIQVSGDRHSGLHIHELTKDYIHPHMSDNGMCSDSWPMAQSAWDQGQYKLALMHIITGLSVIEYKTAYRWPAEMRKCQRCGRWLVENYYTCSNCSMVVCAQCMPDDSAVCETCREDGYE